MKTFKLTVLVTTDNKIQADDFNLLPDDVIDGFTLSRTDNYDFKRLKGDITEKFHLKSAYIEAREEIKKVSPASPNKGENTGKHTPAPWNVTNSGGTIEKGTFSPKWIIATLETVPLRITPEVEANARLIAAAPDMLEALMLIYEDDKVNGILKPQSRVKLKRAINKATGK